MSRPVGHDDRIVTYAGKADAVWHAVVLWSGGRKCSSVDGSDPVAVGQVLAPDLFGGQRRVVISDIDRCDRSVLEGRDRAIEVIGTVIEDRGGRRKRGEWLRVIACDQKWVEAAISDVFTDAGVSIAPRALRTITMGCSTDLARVRSIAAVAQLSGMTQLDERAVGVLLGSVKPEAKIFEICDHLFDGKLEAAITVSHEIEDVVVMNQLTEQLRLLLAARELGVDALTSSFSVHPYVAKRRVATARRFAREQIERALETACRQEIAVRSRESTAEISLTRVHLVLHTR